LDLILKGEMIKRSLTKNLQLIITNKWDTDSSGDKKKFLAINKKDTDNVK
jgi:hypothetical protein